MKKLFNRLSAYFKGRKDKRESLKYIYITANGGFGMKSEHIFRDKEESLKTLRALDKIVKARMKHQEEMKRGKR